MAWVRGDRNAFAMRRYGAIGKVSLYRKAIWVRGRGVSRASAARRCGGMGSGLYGIRSIRRRSSGMQSGWRNSAAMTLSLTERITIKMIEA